MYSKDSFEQAIEKYKQGYEKLKKELQKIQNEHDYNPQSEELLNLYKQITSNLSNCYTKIGKSKESIDLDKKIIELDPAFHKAYARLFDNYIKIGNKDEALKVGELLLKFDDEIKKKYEEEKDNVIAKISKLKNELVEKKPKDKKGSCSCLKCFIPFVILLIAVGVYLYLYRKEEVLKYAKDLKKKLKK